jgi:hypothetical protein
MKRNTNTKDPIISEMYASNTANEYCGMVSLPFSSALNPSNLGFGWIDNLG